jgi:hypothetical protein
VYAASFVLDYLDGFDLVTDVAPGVPGANLGDALDQQSQQSRDASPISTRSGTR